MALIKPVNTESIGVKIRYPKILDIQIKEYMKWVGVEEPSIFFQQAAEYILHNDKQWKTHKKQ